MSLSWDFGPDHCLQCRGGEGGGREGRVREARTTRAPEGRCDPLSPRPPCCSPLAAVLFVQLGCLRPWACPHPVGRPEGLDSPRLESVLTAWKGPSEGTLSQRGPRARARTSCGERAGGLWFVVRACRTQRAHSWKASCGLWPGSGPVQPCPAVSPISAQPHPPCLLPHPSPGVFMVLVELGQAEVSPAWPRPPPWRCHSTGHGL